MSATAGVVSSVVFLGSYNGGTTGGGAAFIEGDHRPGNSPALVSFGGDLFYGGGSKLNIELGGLARGAQYDAVDSAGTIVLSGALNVSLLTPFTPAIGNSFTILTATGGITGQFASASAPSISGVQWQIAYSASSVALTASLLGDYNRNGVVDAADYVVWRKLLGQSGAFLAADGDGNGVIQVNDLNVWRTHFGQSAGSGAGVSANASVPEPATMVLLVLAAAGWCLQRRRAA